LSYLVLARKWRPQGFEEVIGQDSITRTLRNAVRQGRVGHAFLFAGPRGVGKTTMARLLAKALNCDQGPTEKPCGECTPCRQIASSSSLDVLEIDGASNTGVDDIRELRETVRYMPSSARYKVYIIDEVHMLSTSAFNALLKTLEEPPPHVIFIFATTEPHKVPATVQSRCLRFDFQRIPLKLIVDRLRQVCQGEGIKIGEAGLLFIAREAEGSMRDALSFLDHVTSFAGMEVDDEQIIQTLGILERKYLYDLSEAVLNNDVKRSLEIANQVYQQGYDMKQFYRELLEHFRNLAVAKYVKDAKKLMDLPDNELEELAGQVKHASAETLQLLFDILARGEEEASRARDPKLILEMTLARMSHLMPVVPMEEVIKRLSKLAEQVKGSSGMPPESGVTGGIKETEEPSLFDVKSPSASQEKFPPSKSQAQVSWEGFLKFAENKNAKLAALLKHGTYKGIRQATGEKGGGEVRVSFPKGSFYSEQMSAKSSTKSLKKLTEDFFGQGYSLVLEDDTEDSGKENERDSKPAGDYQDRAQELRKQALENPLVQEVIDMFDGEVKEVKIK
jgi:DNA polymerase-3 subunit gamma/tau